MIFWNYFFAYKKCPKLLHLILQLWILKIYAFCRKIQQRALGPGESCWGYVSVYENAPEKLPHLLP